MLVPEGSMAAEDIALPAARAPHTRSPAVLADRLQDALAARSPAIPVMAEATIDPAGALALRRPAPRPRLARTMAAMATTATRAAIMIDTAK